MDLKQIAVLALVFLAWKTQSATLVSAPLPSEEKKAAPAEDAAPAAAPKKAAPKKEEPKKEEAAQEKAKAILKEELKKFNLGDLKAALKAVGDGVKAAGGAGKVATTQRAEGKSAEGKAESPEDGEKAEEKTKRKRPRKPRKPTPPMFRMRDGTRIAGKTELKALSVTTAYGRLDVPLKELVRLRFSRPVDSKRSARIKTLVEQLGSDEFDLREEAMEDLRAIGVAALDALKEASQSEDQEVKTRAEKLVVELEEDLEDEEEDLEPHLVPLRQDEDEIVTSKFTAIGHIDMTSFLVNTPYGELNLKRDEILSVVFRELPFLRKTFKVTGSGAYAGNNKWIDTKFELEQGASYRMTGTGSLQLSNYNVSTGPDGTTNVSGNQLDEFPVGALVARIGKKGKPFKVGTEYEGVVSEKGNLFLGISLKSGSSQGGFDVEIEVEIDEEEAEENE